MMDRQISADEKAEQDMQHRDHDVLERSERQHESNGECHHRTRPRTLRGDDEKGEQRNQRSAYDGADKGG